MKPTGQAPDRPLPWSASESSTTTVEHVGGALGVALPPTGWRGFTVAAALLVLAVGLTLWSLRTRRARRTTDREAWT